MSDEKKEPQSAEEARIEREIRAGRKFSVAEAIGRAAGDLMKGVSPVTLKRQAELEIEQYLQTHLLDSEGVLVEVLKRRVRDSETLLSAGYERPMEALTVVAELILASEGRLRRFVREVDMEWGRIYSERPFFDLVGRAPHPEDPYTIESVRVSLSVLVERLRSED